MNTQNITQPNIEPTEHLSYGRLISLINSMSDGVIAIDKNINIVLFNGAALNILNRNNLNSGEPLTNVLKPLDKNNQPVDMRQLINDITIPTSNRDMHIVYEDGSMSNLYMSITPVHPGFGADGQEGYVLMLRDITYEKSLEDEKDEFVSVVSHELRTPVTIAEGNISNALLIFSQHGPQETIDKALQEAHRQILYLADMINDLATLSHAERGRENFDTENINVPDLIEELVRNYQSTATNKGLYIKAIIDPKLETLRSSKLYVVEILQNIITNALKYTANGGVTIAAKQHEKGIEINIIDTGIGISKPDQLRIFDKFFRSEDYRTRQSSGTGLGLYVSMKLANLINTDITFKSELNVGTTFNIYFPSLN